MIDSFTAIDFETSQGKRWSICQIGLVRVENGTVREKFSILVRPPYNFYWDWFTDIHGITPELTANAPTFAFIWQQIEPFFTNQQVVAHNGFAFDFECLMQTLEFYNISCPPFTGHCTYKIYGESLASLCEQYAIPLNHHDALSDAMACAALYGIYLSKQKRANGST